MLYMPMLPLPQSGPLRLNFTVREITSGYDKRRFVRFAARLYRGDRYWAPGVISERMRALDPKKNPALAHIQLGLFIAESRTLDQVVGTVAVWVDDRSDKSRSAQRVGHFGMFEVINEGEVASSLLETAETWVQEHLPGAKGLRGPVDLDPCRSPGLLVDGYNLKPASLMPYNPPYYPELLETTGYEPGTVLLAYRLDLSRLKDPRDASATRLQAEARTVQASRELVVRDLSGESDWRAILPEAEQGSSGASWLIGPESPALATLDLLVYLKRIAARRPSASILVAQSRESGDSVGFGVLAPNIQEPALVALGRRLTDGWLGSSRGAFSAASGASRKAGIRLLPVVARMDCLDWGLERLMLSELLHLAAQQGYAATEISPVPAGDTATGQTLAELGVTCHKTYHIYENRF